MDRRRGSASVSGFHPIRFENRAVSQPVGITALQPCTVLVASMHHCLLRRTKIRPPKRPDPIDLTPSVVVGSPDPATGPTEGLRLGGRPPGSTGGVHRQGR